MSQPPAQSGTGDDSAVSKEDAEAADRMTKKLKDTETDEQENKTEVDFDDPELGGEG